MRKILIGFVVVALISVAAYFRFHRAREPLEVAYAANREVTVWSSTAQVRAVVATANFGDPLGVLSRFGEQVQVRMPSGIVGWVSEHDLLSAELWQQAKTLASATAARPVEARGHTRVLSNLHLDPSRDSQRIRQLNKGVPIDMFERRIESIPAPTAKLPAPPDSPGDASNAKKEDWWLVRAQLPGHTAAAGWILSRFIDLDIPAPLPDYASSAGMRIVAWFELNHVSDATGQIKPQYLVVGDRGAEGQVCDFTLMRVFTWGTQRQRYETAFVESNICGKLPVTLAPAAAPGADASFAFEDLSSGPPERRLYKMHQTIVRRIRAGGAPSKEPAHPAKLAKRTKSARAKKPRLTLPPHPPGTSAGSAVRN
jgi:hypothetical protein